MTKSWQLPRRTFLKGIGAALSLPMLDAMLPAPLITGSAFAGAGKKAPNRLAFLYVPNGVNMEHWTPEKEGFGYQLPATLAPLEPFRSDMLVFSGLTQDKARPNGDGPGDHARAASAFLTGCQPFKTSGANIKVGISADQVAAAKVGQGTLFPSLELGCDSGAQSGDCDSGYSCAYSNTISWKDASTPLLKEINPRLLFERLFADHVGGAAAESRARRELYRKSILDLVEDDANRLRRRLGIGDQKKLDEYLASVREIETRIERTEKRSKEAVAKVKAEEGFEAHAQAADALATTLPPGVPGDYGEHMKLLMDILVLAFQADLTRISTFMLAHEGSNKSYAHVGVPEGHHDLSHHGGDKKKLEKIARINLFHVEHLAYFLGKLKSVKEEGSTLLDNCMIVYGSGIGDGNRHNHDELPVLLLGKGGGTLGPGRHVRYTRNTPLNNLYLSLLDRMELRPDSLGDSTGRLQGIEYASRRV